MGSSRQIFLATDAHKVIWTALYLFAAALLAFMLGVSEYLLVYHTSGLTLSISGVVKVCLYVYDHTYRSIPCVRVCVYVYEFVSMHLCTSRLCLCV